MQIVRKASLSLVVAFSLARCAEAKAPEFYLPGTVYAAPGLECNIYFKNIINTVVPQNYSYQVQAKVGKAKLIRWHWTPEAKDAGTTNPVVIRAWNDEGVVACLTTKVVVAAAPKDPKKKVTFALFADSLTNSGYQDVIYRNMTDAGCTNFTPVGTRRPRKGHKGRWVPHEGIPGYTCSQFLLHCHVTEDELKSAVGTPEYELYKNLGAPRKIGGEDGEYDRQWVRSPLIREENGRPVMDPKTRRPVVDVQMWLDKVNGGRPPDVVMVQLGCNDVFWLKGEEDSLRRQIRSQVMPWYREFLETLQAKMPRAQFVFTAQPLGANQDAFGENYDSGWNEIQHRKIMFSLNKEIERFVAGRKDPRVRLLPLEQAIDPFRGFCNWEMPVNARVKAKEHRATNAVHLSNAGGAQLADEMSAWILAHWDEF